MSTRAWCSSHGTGLRDNCSVDGHYTLQLREPWQLRRRGHEPPGQQVLHRRLPRSVQRGAELPDGRLQDFQRSRLRIWSIYNCELGAAGDVSVSGLLAGRLGPGVQPGGEKPAAHLDAERADQAAAVIRICRAPAATWCF